ncbi:MAG: hypothetical protein Tsb0032_41420 [Kiloniellaceae bacterium]
MIISVSILTSGMGAATPVRVVNFSINPHDLLGRRPFIHPTIGSAPEPDHRKSGAKVKTLLRMAAASRENGLPVRPEDRPLGRQS